MPFALPKTSEAVSPTSEVWFRSTYFALFFAALVAAAFLGAARCAFVFVVRAVTPICVSIQQLLLASQRNLGDLHVLCHPIIQRGQRGDVGRIVEQRVSGLNESKRGSIGASGLRD